MTLQNLGQAWNRFFFTPQSPTSLGLFRILYGACVTCTLLLLHFDWLSWFGVDGWVSLPAMQTIEPGPRINLFTVMPQDNHWITAFFWVFLAFALLLTAGLWTRFSSIIVFVCITSMHQRNLFINNGGDTFLRVAGFFLMFAPAGAALSLDRLLRIRRGLEGPVPPPIIPWAQRMIQLELAMVYLFSFWWKMKGNSWVHGTALYYVLNLHSLTRFPLPQWVQTPLAEKLGTWFTLLFECCMGILVWIRPLRYPMLLIGLFFHLCLEYALNIPMFQWDILAAYVLFIDPADLTRLWHFLRRTITKSPDLKQTTADSAA